MEQPICFSPISYTSIAVLTRAVLFFYISAFLEAEALANENTGTAMQR
jgi:hypothetical protein